MSNILKDGIVTVDAKTQVLLDVCKELGIEFCIGRMFIKTKSFDLSNQQTMVSGKLNQDKEGNAVKFLDDLEKMARVEYSSVKRCLDCKLFDKCIALTKMNLGIGG